MVKRSFSEDDLRAYLSDSAGPELASRIEAEADTDNALRAEIALMRGMLVLARQDQSEEVEDQLGWQRLKQTLAAEAKESAKPRSSPSAAFGWRAAAVFFGLLAIGQGAFIATTGAGGDVVRYETASAPAADAHILAVSFVDGAQADQMTALLQTYQASVVDGPGATGLYRLSFATEEAQAQALTALSSSPLLRLVAEE